MKKFLVLSDTHIPIYQRDLPKVIYEMAREVDGIIALGDFVDLDTVLSLEAISEIFHGVHGNVDGFDVKAHLPESKVVMIEDLTLALAHGWGPPWDLRKRLFEKFSFDPSIDVILYGHTHEYFDGVEFGKRFLNPGTATPGGTFAMMTVDGRDLRFEILRI